VSLRPAVYGAGNYLLFRSSLTQFISRF